MAKSGTEGPDYFVSPASWATPLCYAVCGSHIETAKFLIKKGAKVKGNERVLFEAFDGNCDILRLLVQHGADPSLLPQVLPDEGELFELISSYGIAPCLLYTSPSPRDATLSRMPSSA